MATTTRAKVTNKPTLKSQGAGYSTTNRKGVTTFYKSAKDASGYSDNSKGKAVSTVDKTGTAIPMTALQTTDVANVPPAPTYSNPGVFTAPTIATATDVNQGFQNNQDWLNTALQSAYNEVGTGESRMAKLERDNQLKQKEQAVNNAQEQLNQIQTQSQAQQLALEGQGRGQTSAFVGGEQARINREAAIAALPVQAQLAAAQNNLEMAQTHIDKLFSIQSQDAQTKYQYKTKVIDSIYNFANAQQQRQLDQLNLQESRKYDEKKTNIAYQRDLASQAMQYGQSTLASSIMRLDPTSPTYANELARVAGQIQKPVDPVSAKAPDLQNFGTADNPDWRQYNPSTGGYDEIAGVGGSTTGNLSKVQRAKVSDSVVANKELAANIQEYKDLLDKVGFEGTTWGGKNLGEFDALRGRITTTLKKAETLGTLDAGVLQLVDQLIGQRPEKGGLTQNFLGFGSRRVSSSLGKQIELIQNKIKTDEERLGGGTGFTLTSSDLSELDALFGETSNTTATGIDPAEFF